MWNSVWDINKYMKKICPSWKSGLRTEATVYPKKYAHGFVVLCFVVVMQSFIMNSHEVFIHIHQGCFAGTGAIVRVPQCQWGKPDEYGKISQCITTTKHSKAKTVCIFLGIYCRQARHSHPPYLYAWTYIFFWMRRAQIIRICNVEMKIWGCTPSSGAFSKWLSWRKCWKTKNRNFRTSTSDYHRYTQFTLRYMFLRMTNTVMLVKNSLHVTTDFKIQDGRSFWPKNRSRYEIN